MSDDMTAKATRLAKPSSQQLLDELFDFGLEIHLDMDEATLVRRFSGMLERLFPERKICVRVVDLRSEEPARVYCGCGRLRAGVSHERFTLRRSSIERTRLKGALVESARMRVAERWDGPFEGTAMGFCVPLVAAGELYGVLDIGYPLGASLIEEDEKNVLPLANQLSVALRNARLHRETIDLRDYQSRLIEQANALILGVGRDWRIKVCNGALCELTGFSEQELIGVDLRDWLLSNDQSRLTRLFELAMDGQSSESVDVAIPTKQGESVRTVWSVAAVASKGHRRGLVGVGHDQTRLRQLQEQIIQAEKLATVGQLAAGVVHELNNPLTSITVYSEYLLKKLASSDAVGEADLAKVRQIGSSARRIMAFAKELVQYAKPSTQAAEVVPLNHAVKQGVSFCEHLFSGAGIEVEELLDDGAPEVFAISGQIEQVVINLVTNAVQAMKGGGKVRVSTRAHDEQGVIVEISDSGPGIPSEARARVFEPFFTTKSDGEGTGLGLSIVKNIVEQGGGEIEVADGELGGACFRISWPSARSANSGDHSSGDPAEQ